MEANDETASYPVKVYLGGFSPRVRKELLHNAEVANQSANVLAMP